VGNLAGGFVPEWAKRAVWYQVFPERFRNGDPANDPTRESIRGAYPHVFSEPWEVHPWTSDWYELKPYERANGRGFWHNVLRRRYGGDLQGILDKLDYIQDLGATALYLNPVFMAPSAHKYDGATYHHVDPHFGPDPAGDMAAILNERPDDSESWVWTAADRLLLDLVAEVHRRGMRIILDGVFNHVGVNHWAFRDVAEKGRESAYADWFVIKSIPGESTAVDRTPGDDLVEGPADLAGLVYRAWRSVPELPEWREDEDGTVPGPRRYIFDITRRWMDPHGTGDLSEGIDGWRLDVAVCVRHPFWKAWRAHVRSINPEAYLVAEIVEPIPVLASYLQGDEFEAVMNYDFLFAVDEFFIRTRSRITATQFDKRLRELRDAFPSDVAYGMQNLLSSHDSERIGSHIMNHDLAICRDWSSYLRITKATNPAYTTRKPDEDALRTQKLIVIFQMTYLGAPMIYYGDEVGMWGANDPCCRKPMVWEDLQYEDETVLPDQSPRAVRDPVRVDHSILDHYRKLIAIRAANPALQVGSFQTLLTDDRGGCYAYQRADDGNRVVVILNTSALPRRVGLAVPSGRYSDALNADTVLEAADGVLTTTVPPGWGRVFVAG
jgi:cyclomaltodextrinase